MSPPLTLVWFRRDLRLADQPALAAAAERGAVLPVFIWAPEEEDPWAPGAASRWWLHHSLAALRADLAARGLPLVLRAGPSLATLRALVRETGATAVMWNRLYEPAATRRDLQIKAELRGDGLEVRTFNAALLHEPWVVLTQQDRPYQVFTPYHRACQALGEPERPRAAPARMQGPAALPESLELEAFGLLPKLDWAGGLRKAWTPGERGARALLEEFAGARAEGYAEGRDRPDAPGTSRLSPHLHFGEVSPRQVWRAVRTACGNRAEPYLRQLVWREFAHHLLHHFPRTADEPLRADFRHFPWRKDPSLLVAWQRGRTGYPIVDAGLRELWATGWMHNRVRMIAGSFLVKDLLLPWQAGARWFWDTLVDADLANNTLGWQWVAGCGADAAPYFRIFNPELQAKKFDPAGAYVRRWVPELARLPDGLLHRPDGVSEDLLRAAGIALGTTYPRPLVDHAEARDRALEAYQQVRRGAPEQPPK